MLARLQRVASLLWLGALLAVIAAVAHAGRVAWWHAALLVPLLGGHALVLAGEFTLLRREHARISGETIAWRTLARAWAREMTVAVPTFLWRQPWATHAVPDFLPPAAHGRRGVVLVHGFICNRALWAPWMRRLRARGTPCVAVTLEPVFGSIDDYAATIEGAVRQLEAATGLAPVVVAHSMGGLAVRAWMRAQDAAVAREVAKGAGAGGMPPRADHRVHRVLTLGTPHRGTRVARIGLGENARQMQPGSPWLEALGATEDAERRARFTCGWSECDQIVLPVPTAVLPGAAEWRLPGVAHVALAQDERVWEALVRLLPPCVEVARPS